MNKDKFFSKMKKKPEQQAVIDHISDYTEDQINNLSGPHFPQWIKDQLLELRKRNGKTADDIAAIVAAKMIEASKNEIR